MEELKPIRPYRRATGEYINNGTEWWKGTPWGYFPGIMTHGIYRKLHKITRNMP